MKQNDLIIWEAILFLQESDVKTFLKSELSRGASEVLIVVEDHVDFKSWNKVWSLLH